MVVAIGVFCTTASLAGEYLAVDHGLGAADLHRDFVQARGTDGVGARAQLGLRTNVAGLAGEVADVEHFARAVVLEHVGAGGDLVGGVVDGLFLSYFSAYSLGTAADSGSDSAAATTAAFGSVEVEDDLVLVGRRDPLDRSSGGLGLAFDRVEVGVEVGVRDVRGWRRARSRRRRLRR